MRPKNRRLIDPRWLVALAATAAPVLATSRAWAVGEAATKFELFVPPNAVVNGRYAMLIVTAVSRGATGVTNVDIVDDGADGDTDDSVTGLQLSRGQSRVVYIKDGAVNDDFGGKWDGDLFEVSSDAPVVVQMATRSDWQHDWMPADNKTMVGQQFYVFAADTPYSYRDLDVFALGQPATVKISRISTAQTLSSATTQVDLTAPVPLLTTTLAADCDLMNCNGLGVDVMQPGQTYLVETTAPVSVVTGSLANLTNTSNARDGGGFVPAITGGGVGRRFTFSIPHDPGLNREQELRVVSFGAGSANLEGYDVAHATWNPITTFDFSNVLGHGDLVGTGYELFRLTSDVDTSVFEANWLETGAIGTSDIASFVPALGGLSSGTQFLAYVGPPGNQANVAGILGTYSHLTAYARKAGTTITVVDDDTNGATFTKTMTASPGSPSDFLISSAQWNATNDPTHGRRPYFRVTADKPITLVSANYNDNWQTFAPGILAPSPFVDVTATGDGTIACSQSVTVTSTVTNPTDADLSTMSIVTSVPTGLTVDAAADVTETGLAAPTITTSATSTIVTYAAAPLLAHGTRQVTITMHLPCDAGSPTNGSLLSVRTLATGTGADDGETYSTQGSDAVTVLDSSHTVIDAPIVSFPGDIVHGTFLAERESGTLYFEILRASLPTDTPVAVTGHIASLGDETSGRTYPFTDSTAQVNHDYFYWVRATNTDGSTTLAGPTHLLVKDLVAPPVPVIAATGETSDIRVDLSDTPKPVDFAGYAIYRALGNGAFTTLVVGPLNASSYVDTSALPWQPYRYKAVALNSSLTASDYSNVATAQYAPTSASTPHVVMFEDRLGEGANDWDFNDFVASVDAVETYAGSNVSAYDLSIEALARGANYRHALRYAIAAQGAWTATITVFADATAQTVVSTSTVSGTGTVDVPVFADTRVALPPPSGYSMTNTVPGQPWVSGQLARVHVALASPASNPAATKPAMPYGPYLRLLQPALGDVQSSTPVPTVEIVDDAQSPLVGVPVAMSVAVQTSSRIWATETTPMWTAFQNFSDYELSSGTDPRTFHDHPIQGSTISKGGQ